MKPSKTPIYIEFKEASVHVLDGDQGAEFPIEREAGRVTAASAALLSNGLRGFLQREGAVGPRQAICALPARGITMRTISLPASATKDDSRRLLAMQIEAQFPVPPSELAWGYARLPDNGSAQAEFLVAATKREVIEEYNALLGHGGISAQFTPAALARVAALPGEAEVALVEIGAEKSELIVVDAQGRPSLRVLNWGRAHLSDPDALGRLLPETAGRKLFLSGAPSPAQSISAVGKAFRAESLVLRSGPGMTSATAGLQRAAERGQTLLFLGGQDEPVQRFVAPRLWKWPAIAAGLLLLAISLRYAEAMFFQSQVSAKLAELNKYRGTLPNVEKELGFLTYIKTNQPPYLDTIAVVASSAPPGTRLDQVSIVRRGEVSLRGSIQNPQGPEQFRTKLIGSGFFSKVVVEEQGPGGQDRNKLNFRITAILKPEGERKVLPPDPPSTNKTAGASSPGGPMPMGEPMMVPPGAFPPGMPSGAMPPGAMPPGAVPSGTPSGVVPQSAPPTP